MPVTAAQVRRRIDDLEARDSEIEAEIQRLDSEREMNAVEKTELETTLRVVTRMEGLSSPNGEHPRELKNEADEAADAEFEAGLLAEMNEVQAQHNAVLDALRSARTVADACEIGLNYFGGVATGRQLFRLLMRSGRLAEDGIEPGKAYNRMAGMLRKTPSRFRKVGYARWQLVRAPGGIVVT